MSSEGPNGGNGDANPRNRRGSITQAALSNLFQRGSSSTGSNGQSINGGGQSNPAASEQQRRRLSVTTLGLSGTSQNGAPALGIRRGSMSTNSNNSDSIDENAIEDEDVAGARTVPTTPFTRRMSYGGSAMRGYRPGGSPGNGNNPTSPPSSLPTRGHSQRRGSVAQGQISAAIAERRASVGMPMPKLMSTPSTSSVPQASNTKHTKLPSDSASRPDQQGFNWSEQLRSRAESAVSGGPRPSFSMASTSPPRAGASAPHHDRAKSVSDMPVPPVQAPAPPKPAPEPRKPDAFQERILKGDFYMD